MNGNLQELIAARLADRFAERMEIRIREALFAAAGREQIARKARIESFVKRWGRAGVVARTWDATAGGGLPCCLELRWDGGGPIKAGGVDWFDAFEAAIEAWEAFERETKEGEYEQTSTKKP